MSALRPLGFPQTRFRRWMAALCAGIGLMASLSGCDRIEGIEFPAFGDSAAPSSRWTTTPSPAPTSIPVDTASPTAILIPHEREPETELIAPPTAAPDPLVFEFPVPQPIPVSAWRPPIYPIPWAPTPYDHFYLARPIAADEINSPLANYRYGGVFFENVVHTGVDIPAPSGTPVLAAGDGRVIWASYGLYRGVYGDTTDPYGIAVVIRHDFGHEGQRLYTVYGHLQQVDVVRGQHVEMGEQIGLVGETGVVTGPHLHLEVRVGGNDFFTTLNPELWLVPPQGWGLIAGRVMFTSGDLYPEAVVTIANRDAKRMWEVITYAEGAANSDPFYRENMVIGDLPAGVYELSIEYGDSNHTLTLEVFPGRVSYFTFLGNHGFQAGIPSYYIKSYIPQEIRLTSP